MHIEGTVTAIRHGDKDAETEVVIKTGSVSVIVTKQRKPYHYEADFTRLGLEPRKADIVVVKIGYLQPELYDMRADHACHPRVTIADLCVPVQLPRFSASTITVPRPHQCQRQVQSRGSVARSSTSLTRAPGRR